MSGGVVPQHPTNIHPIPVCRIVDPARLPSGPVVLLHAAHGIRIEPPRAALRQRTCLLFCKYGNNPTDTAQYEMQGVQNLDEAERPLPELLHAFFRGGGVASIVGTFVLHWKNPMLRRGAGALASLPYRALSYPNSQ